MPEPLRVALILLIAIVGVPLAAIAGDAVAVALLIAATVALALAENPARRGPD